MQSASEVAPITGEYFPAPQLMHKAYESAPIVVENFPETHSLQVKGDGAPVTIENLPAAQLMQAAEEFAPVDSEYLPAKHSMQSVVDFAPVAVAYLPASQLLQAADPAATLYFPVPQRVHVPPSAPVDPGLHEQAVKAELHAVELEFVGHEEHDVATVDAEYLPSAHGLHASSPDISLNVPATHA